MGSGYHRHYPAISLGCRPRLEHLEAVMCKIDTHHPAISLGCRHCRHCQEPAPCIRSGIRCRTHPGTLPNQPWAAVATGSCNFLDNPAGLIDGNKRFADHRNCRHCRRQQVVLFFPALLEIKICQKIRSGLSFFFFFFQKMKKKKKGKCPKETYLRSQERMIAHTYHHGAH